MNLFILLWNMTLKLQMLLYTHTVSMVLLSYLQRCS